MYIYHKMLATAKSKKIDFDIGESFFYSPVPLDLKAELLGCLIWPESKTAYHGERCQEQWCHMKKKLSSTNSKWSQGNLYFNWYKEQPRLVFLSGQEWFSSGQLNFVLINKMYEMLWSLHSIWQPFCTMSTDMGGPTFPVFQALTTLEGHQSQWTVIKYVCSLCRQSHKCWNLNVNEKETPSVQFALYP